MPSKISWLLQGTAVTSLTGLCSFAVWTKHTKYTPIDPDTDPSFRSQSFRKFNPNWNPTYHDLYIRRIPLAQLDPRIRQDAKDGGDKLVTRFTQGILGGFVYSAQRRILTLTNKNDATKNQLWTKQDLLTSGYEQGTDITDHFRVVERDSQKVVIRGGTSPLTAPDGPRENDALFELEAEADFESGFAEFRVKSILFQAVGEMSPVAVLHRVYTKMLMENAVSRCKEGLTANIDWDMVTGRVMFQDTSVMKEKLDKLEVRKPKS